MAAPHKTHTLNNGLQIPLVGLGCWIEKQAGEEENVATEKMVTDALKVSSSLNAKEGLVEWWNVLGGRWRERELMRRSRGVAPS